MKLTKIEPVWEYIPLAAGWTGEAYGNISDGRVTIRINATRSEGAGTTMLILPPHMKPGERIVHDMYPTRRITPQSRILVWLSKGSIMVTVDSSTPVDTDISGELTYMT